MICDILKSKHCKDSASYNCDSNCFHYKSSTDIAHAVISIFLMCIVFMIIHPWLINNENFFLQFVHEDEFNLESILLVVIFSLHKEIIQILFVILLLYNIYRKFYCIYIYSHRRLFIDSDKIIFKYGWPSIYYFFVI